MLHPFKLIIPQLGGGRREQEKKERGGGEMRGTGPGVPVGERGRESRGVGRPHFRASSCMVGLISN